MSGSLFPVSGAVKSVHTYVTMYEAPRSPYRPQFLKGVLGQTTPLHFPMEQAYLPVQPPWVSPRS